MRVRLKLKPGQKGTKKLVAEYGTQLFCVRYRYDAVKKKRFKTVELIVEEVSWQPKQKVIKEDKVIEVKVSWGDLELYRKVKDAGGKWNREKRVWELKYEQALKFGVIGNVD